jgi:hypothetical protein
MGWIALALQMLAQLPKLLKIAEKAFDEEPDSGAQKKEMVLTAVKTIAIGVLGEKGWDKIDGIVNPVIDVMCYFFFPNDKKKK